MKEELISFETAKLAKEKGFTTHTVTTKFTNDYLLGGKNMMINETCILLWMCELQKWLREVHKIEVYIRPFINVENHEKHYRCFVVWFDGKMYQDNIFFNGEIYEETLEKGLRVALEYIK